VIIDS